MFQKRIMKPDHPKWSDFVRCMKYPAFCNRLKEIPTEIMCHGDTSYGRALLETFPGINVEATLDYFKQFGGHCDCAIALDMIDLLLRN